MSTHPIISSVRGQRQENKLQHINHDTHYYFKKSITIYTRIEDGSNHTNDGMTKLLLP